MALLVNRFGSYSRTEWKYEQRMDCSDGLVWLITGTQLKHGYNITSQQSPLAHC